MCCNGCAVAYGFPPAWRGEQTAESLDHEGDALRLGGMDEDSGIGEEVGTGGERVSKFIRCGILGQLGYEGGAVEHVARATQIEGFGDIEG